MIPTEKNVRTERFGNKGQVQKVLNKNSVNSRANDYKIGNNKISIPTLKMDNKEIHQNKDIKTKVNCQNVDKKELEKLECIDNSKKEKNEIDPELKKLFEIDADKSISIFNEKDRAYLESVGYQNYIIDSILLQKLTYLDSNLARQLIYNCLINQNKKIMKIDNEKEEPKTKKRKVVNNYKKLKTILATEIYNILIFRLNFLNKKTADMFFYLFLLLNEKSNFTINRNDMLMMLNGSTMKKHKQINNNNNSNNNTIKNKSRNTINTRSDSVVKYRLPVQNMKKISENVDEINTTDNRLLLINDIVCTRKDLPFKIDENNKNILEDFKTFLKLHGVGGVKTLGKVITTNICNTLSKLSEQNLVLEEHEDNAKQEDTTKEGS